MTAQREWFEKDYYKILGVAEDAKPKDITRAYRQLARKYHPDTNSGDPKAEEQFKEVSSAYDVVGDAEKRKEYDEVRRLGPAAAGFGGGGFGPGGSAGGAPGGAGFGNFRVDDLGDLLGGMFGGRSRRGGTRTAPRKGADLEAELHLSFADAVHGVTTTLGLTSDAPCSTCHGSGAAPGTAPVSCSRCGGRGVIDDNQGLFSFSQPCPACGGRGTVVTTPCPTCAGRGVERRARDVKVRIPAGVEDGQRIRLAGRGDAGRDGGPAGDLVVRVHVGAHERFGRKGCDLTLSVPITYAEATLGTELTVPTLDGPTVTVRIPPGTRHGRTFRVAGRGVDAKKGPGDLLVTVQIAVPTNPSARERELLEQLAELDDGSLRAHLAS